MEKLINLLDGMRGNPYAYFLIPVTFVCLALLFRHSTKEMVVPLLIAAILVASIETRILQKTLNVIGNMKR